MDYIKVLTFLAQFDMKDIQAAMKEVKEVVAVLEKLKEPGNTRNEIAELLKELADACNAISKVIEEKK